MTDEISSPQPQQSAQSPTTIPVSQNPGLTLLAIINFIAGGLGIIALFIIVLSEHESSRPGRNLFDPGINMFDAYIIMILRFVNIVLVISSGFGYLGRKKVLGWVVGNIYACWAILTVVISAWLEGRFGILSGFWLLYPLLTLILLNTVFRKSFVSMPAKL